MELRVAARLGRPRHGVERAGSGVVIRESGLVLTIGYLITEAESVWLTAGTR